MNRRQERYYSVAAGLTTAEWQSLEIKRYIDSETPGKFGWFTVEDAK